MHRAARGLFFFATLCFTSAALAEAPPATCADESKTAFERGSLYDPYYLSSSISMWKAGIQNFAGGICQTKKQVYAAPSKYSSREISIEMRRMVFDRDAFKRCQKQTNAYGALLKSFATAEGAAEVQSWGETLFGKGWGVAYGDKKGVPGIDVVPSRTMGKKIADLKNDLGNAATGATKDGAAKLQQTLFTEVMTSVSGPSTYDGITPAIGDSIGTMAGPVKAGFDLVVAAVSSRCKPQAATATKGALPVLFQEGGEFIYEVNYVPNTSPLRSSNTLKTRAPIGNAPESITGYVSEVMYYRIWVGKLETGVGRVRYVPLWGVRTPVIVPGTESYYRKD